MEIYPTVNGVYCKLPCRKRGVVSHTSNRKRVLLHNFHTPNGVLIVHLTNRKRCSIAHSKWGVNVNLTNRKRGVQGIQCVQWNHFKVKRFLLPAGPASFGLLVSRPALNLLSYQGFPIGKQYGFR